MDNTPFHLVPVNKANKTIHTAVIAHSPDGSVEICTKSSDRLKKWALIFAFVAASTILALILFAKVQWLTYANIAQIVVPLPFFFSTTRILLNRGAKNVNIRWSVFSWQTIPIESILRVELAKNGRSEPSLILQCRDGKRKDILSATIGLHAKQQCALAICEFLGLAPDPAWGEIDKPLTPYPRALG